MTDDESANGEESAPEEAEADEEEESEGRELEYEHYHAREEVVAHLESFLEGFREGDTVSLTIGEETIELEPPEHLNFEVEYEEEDDTRELEFELEWEERTEDLEIGSS
ncbi:amphi-Trp domain-containing protein [Halopiger aswanensis]|uniref:Amphi-Trp domain-containing protein n=1 Tax=Halopiger aswanensis TaxID=148449 RepID=A0A419VXW0_9EURY|nr:amphi-Trp domain-containing protein [Halopiger aswanensis]RKD88062.1 amphi-Trp domain-containing protein [Halopiger aswanensis]